MATYTRKEFLGFSAVLAGGAGVAKLPVAAAQEPGAAEGPPDLVVVNARVYTVDDALPRAEAFAVRGDRFVAVGSSDDVRNLVGPGTEVIDAEGMTVTPGFIDTHSHPSGVNELYGVNTNLRTVAEIQRALRSKALDTPPGRWVRGFMFDDTKVVDGPLHRTHLDEAVPDHPVNVAHRGGHTNWFNSHAFELAGITRDTPDPPDGRFARGPDGELSGMVAEHARDVFADVGEREDLTEEEQRTRAREGMAHISRLMTAAGLTTVHDAGAGRGRLVAYQDARESGELRHRVYAMVRGPYRDLRAAGVYTGLGDEWVRIGGVKYGADGSASERTMRMSTPFEGRPDDYGILTMSQDDIHEAVEEAHRSNWQVGIHANGDVTIDMVLNAYERVLARWPHPDRRHRIEHCSLVNPDLLRRIRDTGSIPTPFWTYVHFHGEKWREYGAEKMEWMFAHRSFLDYDIPVAGASRLHAGAVLAADGDSEHGDPPRLRRAGVGRQPAGDGGRGAAHRHPERGAGVLRGRGQGLDHRRQARRLRGPRARPARRRSRRHQEHRRRAHGGRRADGARGVGGLRRSAARLRPSPACQRSSPWGCATFRPSARRTRPAPSQTPTPTPANDPASGGRSSFPAGIGRPSWVSEAGDVQPAVEDLLNHRRRDQEDQRPRDEGRSLQPPAHRQGHPGPGTAESGEGSGAAAAVRRRNTRPSRPNPAANPISRLAVTASVGSVST